MENIIYIVAFVIVGLAAIYGLISIAIHRIRYEDVLEYLDDEERH